MFLASVFSFQIDSLGNYTKVLEGERLFGVLLESFGREVWTMSGYPLSTSCG